MRLNNSLLYYIFFKEDLYKKIILAPKGNQGSEPKNFAMVDHFRNVRYFTTSQVKHACSAVLKNLHVSCYGKVPALYQWRTKHVQKGHFTKYQKISITLLSSFIWEQRVTSALQSSVQ